MNYLDCAVALLAQRLPGLVVSGPRDLPRVGSLPPTVIVQAVAGPPLPGAVIRAVLYTLRCYGQTTGDALATWDALHAALTTPEGEPIHPGEVTLTLGERTYRWWCGMVALGSPGTPERHPEGGWMVLAASGLMDWAVVEMEA